MSFDVESRQSMRRTGSFDAEGTSDAFDVEVASSRKSGGKLRKSMKGSPTNAGGKAGGKVRNTESFDAEGGGSPSVRKKGSFDVESGSPRAQSGPARRTKTRKYKGRPLRRFRVKQYHLEDAPQEIELCVEQWRIVLVDRNNRLLQTVKFRNVVCWSGSDDRLNLLLTTFEKVSLKVRKDNSMLQDADNVVRPAKAAAKFLEEHAAAAKIAGEKNPAASELLHEADDDSYVEPFGLHTVTFDSSVAEIRNAIRESHFDVEQTHLPETSRDVQLYVGEMALVVKSDGDFVESHPYHSLLGWHAVSDGVGPRVSIRYLDDHPGTIEFFTDDAKIIRDMMLMHTRKLRIKALDVIGMNPGGNRRNYVNPDSLPDGVVARSPSWAVGWSGFLASTATET